MMLKMPRFVRSIEQSTRNDKKKRDKTERNGMVPRKNIPNESTHTTGSDRKMSLQDVLLTPLSSYQGSKMVETYTMQDEG